MNNKRYNNEALNKIFKETNQRYSDRFEKFGYDVKTLGWGSKQQQEYRFHQLIDENINYKDKVILDIGCGFGDLYSFLVDEKISFKKYIGTDINPDLISKAEELHPHKNTEFSTTNIIEDSNLDYLRADIGIMLGVLNFNLKDKFNNIEFSKIAITKAFALVNDVLIVDFLSDYKDSGYPEEDFVYYHKPEQILSYALTLTQNVVLKHNYSPIPQKEFIVFLYK